MNFERHKGQVALVTGGSRGIGRATSLQLAREGATVVVNYHQRREAAQEVVSEIEAHGGSALALQADVSDRQAVQAMVDQAVQKVSAIDILVNNAGILLQGSLLDYKDEELERMWEINVKGVIHCSAAVAPLMIEKNFGRIINLSSIAALGTGFKGTSFYAATKGAVLILTRRFAYELGADGISVNAICPGYIATDMVLEGKTSEEIQVSLDQVAAKSMLGRAGRPQDIASVISFLASQEAGFVTGQTVTVDGGRMDFLTHS